MMWIIYLITLADRVHVLLFLMGTPCVIGAVLACFFYCFGDGDVIANALAVKWARRLTVAAFVVIVSSVLIPSSATLAAMYLIPKITESAYIQRIPVKALSVIEKKLDEYIKSVK